MLLSEVRVQPSSAPEIKILPNSQRSVLFLSANEHRLYCRQEVESQVARNQIMITIQINQKLSRSIVAGFVLALGLSSAPAFAQQKSEIVRFKSERTVHRVTGWEKGLVKRAPNLSKYYWTPMNQYQQKMGSLRTSKGAKAAPAGPVQQTARHYVKPNFAPMPKNDRIQFAAAETEARTQVDANLRNLRTNAQLASSGRDQLIENCSGVLTYEKDKNGYMSDLHPISKTQSLSVKGQLYGKSKK